MFKHDTDLCNHMPYIDMRDHQEGLVMLQTVHKNFKGFTKCQVEKAILACRIQAIVGQPTDAEFKHMVSSHFWPQSSRFEGKVSEEEA